MADHTESAVTIANAWGGTEPITVRVWYGRHIAPQSGTRHRGWWFAADDCEASGPFASRAEAEQEARASHE